jgi:hypothetical protein
MLLLLRTVGMFLKPCESDGRVRGARQFDVLVAAKNCKCNERFLPRVLLSCK